MSRSLALVRIVWTIASIAAALPILGLTLASAAWNGVNLAVWLCLIAGGAGVLGLIAGFCSAFSNGRFWAWTTISGAVLIALLSAIYAGGFVFSRSPETPLGDPVSVGVIHAPLLAFYAVAFFCCSVEAALYFPRTRRYVENLV